MTARYRVLLAHNDLIQRDWTSFRDKDSALAAIKEYEEDGEWRLIELWDTYEGRIDPSPVTQKDTADAS